MTKSKTVFLIGGYLFVIVLLLLYSYTQVDLGLTLTRWSPVWQGIQRFFQHIGYFNRPLSTMYYLGIVAAMSVFYVFFLILALKRKIAGKNIWIIVCLVTVLLACAYNAFSYDLFNYIFDAKIITHYHESPYYHRALDYQGDPMLGFMHWTHRLYPYGPVWLALTVPLSFIGAQFFLLTFFLFKAAIAASYLGTVYFLGKIAEKITPEKKDFVILFFALNPLVIIEGVVSAHNDIVMMFFALWAVFVLLEKKYLPAFLLLALSIGIKFATVFLLPVFIYVMYFQIKKQHINWEKVFIASLLLMLIPVLFSSQRTEMQPWYLLWVLPFASLVSNLFVFPAIIFSLALILHYVPFLYAGNWDPPIPAIKFWITTAAAVLSGFFIAFNFFFNKKIKENK